MEDLRERLEEAVMSELENSKLTMKQVRGITFAMMSCFDDALSDVSED